MLKSSIIYWWKSYKIKVDYYLFFLFDYHTFGESIAVFKSQFNTLPRTHTFAQEAEAEHTRTHIMNLFTRLITALTLTSSQAQEPLDEGWVEVDVKVGVDEDDMFATTNMNTTTMTEEKTQTANPSAGEDVEEDEVPDIAKKEEMMDCISRYYSEVVGCPMTHEEKRQMESDPELMKVIYDLSKKREGMMDIISHYYNVVLERPLTNKEKLRMNSQEVYETYNKIKDIYLRK